MCERLRRRRQDDHQEHSAGSRTEVPATDGLSQEGRLCSDTRLCGHRLETVPADAPTDRFLTCIPYVMPGLWSSTVASESPSVLASARGKPRQNVYFQQVPVSDSGF